MSKWMFTLIALSVIFITVFFVWHFFFSIYEVKYSLQQSSNKLEKNSTYYIESFGINSFGHELRWRSISSTVSILDGDELVKIIEVKNNKIVFATNSKEGNVVIKIKSDLSLNPALLTFMIND